MILCAKLRPGSGNTKGVRAMRQKSQEILGATRLAIINWLEEASEFVRKHPFHVLALIVSVPAVAFLVYANPNGARFILYIFFFSFALLATQVQPTNDKLTREMHHPITFRWWIFLVTAFLLPIYLMCAHPNFWNAHWRFISLNALAFPVLLFVRQAWPETWQDNRWLIMPAALIALWWANSSWVVTYETSQKWEVQAIYPLPLKDNSLRVSFPRQIPFDESKIPTLKIWCENNIKKDCGGRRVTLQSADKSLLFSYTTEPRIWQSQLLVRLNSSGAEQTILLARNPSEPNGQISLLAHENGEINPLGKITFETESEAQARNFWLTLLQGGSVAVTIIGAVFAGLKQREDERRKEEKGRKDEQEKRERENVFALFSSSYQPGQMTRTAQKLAEQQGVIDHWNEELRKEFKEKFGAWVTDVVKRYWQDEIKNTGQDDFLHQLEAAWQKTDEKTHPALIEIEIARKESDPLTVSCHYPLEQYPLQKLFQQYVKFDSAPQQQAQFGPQEWGLYANPFSQTNNPFVSIQPLWLENGAPPVALNQVHFPFSENRFSHQKYYFLTGWDVQAALYSFCAEFNRDPLLNAAQKNYPPESRRTLFVPVLPFHWKDGFSLQEQLLYCLAERWLEILVSVPNVINSLLPAEQEWLAALLLWRYDSGAIIKSRIILAEQNPKSPLLPVSREFFALLEKRPPQPIYQDNLDTLNWLALRPAATVQTVFLFSEVFPNLPGSPAQSDCIRSLSPDFEKALDLARVFFVRFFLAKPEERACVLALDIEPLRKVLDNHLVMAPTKTNVQTSAFDELLAPGPEEDYEKFIKRAGGSPGTIIKMAYTVLNRHAAKPELLIGAQIERKNLLR